MSPAKTLDLSALGSAVQDADEMPTSRRGRQPAENPFHDVVLDSYNNETPKMVPVPLSGEAGKTGEDKNVTKVVGLIRAAAAAQEIGVSVAVQPHSKTIAHVVFLGKERRTYSRNGDGAAE